MGCWYSSAAFQLTAAVRIGIGFGVGAVDGSVLADTPLSIVVVTQGATRISTLPPLL